MTLTGSNHALKIFFSCHPLQFPPSGPFSSSVSHSRVGFILFIGVIHSLSHLLHSLVIWPSSSSGLSPMISGCCRLRCVGKVPLMGFQMLYGEHFLSERGDRITVDYARWLPNQTFGSRGSPARYLMRVAERRIYFIFEES